MRINRLILPLLTLVSTFPVWGTDGLAGPGSAPLPVRGIYFTETGCNHCDAFLYVGKARLEEQFGVVLELETYDILSSEGYELCSDLLSERGLEFTTFPVLFIGDNAYRGSAAVEEGLRAELESYKATGSWLPAKPVPELAAGAGAASGAAAGASAAAADESARAPATALALAPVIAAGLLDGINPCAFSTMLFFLSFIGLRRKERGVLILTGLSFIAGVFAAYFFLGFGLLAALRTFLSRGRASVYLNAAVSAAAAVMVVLNLRDARAAGRGAVGDSLLQLPASLKRAGHAVIRRFSAAPAVAAGAAATGVLVSFIELACTGQIYLPTLAYMNSRGASAQSVGLLAAYNVAFILPLAGLFLLFLLGTGHEKLRLWYGKRIALVRLLSALFFAALGVLVWVV